jgi:hypothetical protein
VHPIASIIVVFLNCLHLAPSSVDQPSVKGIDIHVRWPSFTIRQGIPQRCVQRALVGTPPKFLIWPRADHFDVLTMDDMYSDIPATGNVR